jgi:Xaa-Pro dipeptidase
MAVTPPVSTSELGYPSFSPAEMQARRGALLGAAEAAEVERLLVYGANRSGSAVQWLTGWPVTREAAALVEPDEPDVLLVQFYNHVPLATALAPTADVRWGGPSTVEHLIDLVAARAYTRRLGVVGPLPFGAYRRLAEAVGELVDLNGAYTQLRLIKSGEELDWLRRGAELSDAAVQALTDHLRPGLTEAEIIDFVERAYVPHGGTTHIHYVATTSMHEPTRCVPAQFPSTRRIRAGDAVVTELSAAWWGYAGQVLRTFAIAAEPTPLFAELHAVAEAAFEAMCAAIRPGTTGEEVLVAAAAIQDAGFSACDDLVHGFGGGYLPPVISAPDRPGGVVPDVAFLEGMTVVVQPNVITRDGRAGVQTGELVHVKREGVESLHRAPRGLLRVGGAI